MKILLDTCVLSEIRKPEGNPKVRAFVHALNAADVFLSVITFGELTKGISLLESGKKKTALQDWLAGLEQIYKHKILPIETETVRIWGDLTAQAQKEGFSIPVSDGLIAATSIEKGLYVATRNIKDFQPTGAMLINPWE